MYKGYYLVYNSLDLEKPNGIEKKILSQKAVFDNAGIKMEFYILEKKNGTYWNYDKTLSGSNFVYFRRGTTIDWRFKSFFKRLKKDNPKIIIFMEIPTYPYDGEGNNSIYSRVTLLIDHFFRRQIKSCIDRIILVARQKEKTLWGINVVNIRNGVDVISVKPRKKENKTDRINIGCIAKFSPWHGYERLIKGLYEYYQEDGRRDLHLLMVGEGIEKEKYMMLVDEYQLNEKVHFYGQLIGRELDTIYNITDIGCCSLGRYKSNIEITSELKSMEFIAKGLPMICGCEIDVLQDINYQYAIFFPNNDSTINIQKVIEFYDILLGTHTAEHISDTIRKKAYELVDIWKTFSIVVKEAKKVLR